MSSLFQTHILNEDGITKARAIGQEFDNLVAQLNKLCPQGREMSIVYTKLQEACFFAKRSMATLPENQKSDL